MTDFAPWPAGTGGIAPDNDAIRAWWSRNGYPDPPPEVAAALHFRHADCTGGESPFPAPPADPEACRAEADRFRQFAWLFAADPPTRNRYLDAEDAYRRAARGDFRRGQFSPPDA